jgi:hypothetical protein
LNAPIADGLDHSCLIGLVIVEALMQSPIADLEQAARAFEVSLVILSSASLFLLLSKCSSGCSAAVPRYSDVASSRLFAEDLAHGEDRSC